MKRITVRVKDDHLALISRAKPLPALAELVWNALDAEATEVRVDFEENLLGGLETIRIRDNGHGLAYDQAVAAFGNLGGSWKRAESRTARRRRALHGQYGKGRFRAFALGNRVEWATVYADNGSHRGFSITGHAASLGQFELTEPAPMEHDRLGTAVAIDDLTPNVAMLRGVQAFQDITDLFALYLRQYPDVRITYDGVPLDPANAEERATDYALDTVVTPNGTRVDAVLTVVEWLQPGKRGLVLCDDAGFALHALSRRPLFRGFSYTAYLKSPYFAALDREGALQLEGMAPELQPVLQAARTALRRHFAGRDAECAGDLLARWKEAGLYPYDREPEDAREARERRVFDIYAAHLGRTPAFAEAGAGGKRVLLRMLREMVQAAPLRAARVLDETMTLPEDKEEEVLGLLRG